MNFHYLKIVKHIAPSHFMDLTGRSLIKLSDFRERYSATSLSSLRAAS